MSKPKLLLNLPKKHFNELSAKSNKTESNFKCRKNSNISSNYNDEDGTYINDFENSSTNSSKYQNKFKKFKIYKSKKHLEKVDEINEEFEHFWEHTKKALKHLFFIWLKIVERFLNKIFNFIFNIISFFLKCIKFVLIGLLYILLKITVLFNKYFSQKKNPFHNMIRYNKLMLIDLNKNYKKLALILDLDHTLVHCTTELPEDNKKNYKKIWIKSLEDEFFFYYLCKRPYLSEFLVDLSKYYNLFIYTKSKQEYAEVIIDEIDKNSLIVNRFCREYCMNINNKHVKDVSLLNLNYPISIILDNSKEDFTQKDNVINIKPFKGDQDDKELLKVKSLLIDIWEKKLFDNSDNIKNLIEKYK